MYIEYGLIIGWMMGGIIDEIVRKPFGGAHLGWQAIMEILSIAIAKHISEL